MGSDSIIDVAFADAQAEDKDAFIAITRLTFQEHSQRLPDEFPAANSRSVEQMITAHFASRKAPPPAPFTRILSAKVGAEVIGYALLVFHYAEHDADSHDLCASVFDISLLPQHRGRGIGKRLLAECVDLMHRVGATKARADVWRGNTASAALFRSQTWRDVNETYVRRIGTPIPGGMPKAKPRLSQIVWELWPIIFTVISLGLIVFLR